MSENFPKDLWLEIPAYLRGEPAEWTLVDGVWHKGCTRCAISPKFDEWYFCVKHSLPEEIDGIPIRIGQYNRSGLFQFVHLLNTTDEMRDWNGGVDEAIWPKPPNGGDLECIVDTDGEPLKYW